MREVRFAIKQALKLLKRLMKSDIAKEVTYKKFESSTFNDSTGQQETIYSEYLIQTIQTDTSIEAQAASTVLSGVGFSAGQVIYIISKDEMPRTDTSHPNILKDWLVDNGVERQIKRAVPIQGVLVLVQV